jgi:hypothetical protein
VAIRNKSPVTVQGMFRAQHGKIPPDASKLFAYEVQIVQELKPDDRPNRGEFANLILNHIDDVNDFCSVTFPPHDSSDAG